MALLTLGSDGEIPMIVIFGSGALVAIIAIIFSGARRIVEARAKEQSRREIAAYIAEGSMTAADGERLMAAGTVKEQKC
jgi:hypothetical protein